VFSLRSKIRWEVWLYYLHAISHWRLWSAERIAGIGTGKQTKLLFVDNLIIYVDNSVETTRE
jgi:hypothetical protein